MSQPIEWRGTWGVLKKVWTGGDGETPVGLVSLARLLFRFLIFFLEEPCGRIALRGIGWQGGFWRGEVR